VQNKKNESRITLIQVIFTTDHFEAKASSLVWFPTASSPLAWFPIPTASSPSKKPIASTQGKQ
jgi:hypothetical protein